MSQQFTRFGYLGRLFSQIAGGSLLPLPIWRVTRNTMVLLASTLAVNAISVPFVAFLARTLGAEGFGVYSIALVFAHVSLMVVDMGAGKLLTREISNPQADSSSIVSALLAPKPLLFVITLIGALLVSDVMGYSRFRTVTIGLSVGIALAMTMAISARSVFHAHQRMEYDVIGMACERLVTIILAVVAVHQGYGVVGVLIAIMIGSMVDATISWVLLKWRFGLTFSIPAFTQVWNGVRSGIPLFLAGLFSTLYMRMGIVILERMWDSDVAGWYSAAFQFLVIVLCIPQILGMAIFPFLSRLAGHDLPMLTRVSHRGAWIMGLGGLLLALCIAYAANGVILVLFSDQYAPSVVILRILVVGLPFTFVSSLLTQELVAMNRQSTVGRVMAVAAAANLVLNLVLVRGFGAIGAAYAAVITEIIVFAQYTLNIRRR